MCEEEVSASQGKCQQWVVRVFQSYGTDPTCRVRWQGARPGYTDLVRERLNSLPQKVRLRPLDP
jgi:hypothetical protein